MSKYRNIQILKTDYERIIRYRVSITLESGKIPTVIDTVAQLLDKAGAK